MAFFKLNFWKTDGILTWCGSKNLLFVPVSNKSWVDDVTMATLQSAAVRRWQQSTFLGLRFIQPRRWFATFNAHQFVTVFINGYYLFIHIPSWSVAFCVSVPVETPQTILFGKKNASFIAVMKFPFSKCVHRFYILYLKHSLLSKYTQCSVRQRTYWISKIWIMGWCWCSDPSTWLFKKYSWSRYSTNMKTNN